MWNRRQASLQYKGLTLVVQACWVDKHRVELKQYQNGVLKTTNAMLVEIRFSISGRSNVRVHYYLPEGPYQGSDIFKVYQFIGKVRHRIDSNRITPIELSELEGTLQSYWSAQFD